MGSCNREIVHDVPPYLRTYNDGTIERLVGTEFAPASFDPETKVSSKDVIVLPGLGARIYRPDSIAKTQKVPVAIYFHGGAFCISSASDPVYHNSLNVLAAEANIIIVSVDFRLVPEHPLRTVYEDSWAVLQWAVSHNCGGGSEEWLRENADFNRMFLSGDSAGANISHHIAIREEKSHQTNTMKFSGLVMIHPYFWGEKAIGLEAKDPVRKAMVDKWWNFVSDSDKGCDDPLINPFTNSSFKGGYECTQRVLVCVAENDILSERGRVYYDFLVKKGGWKGKAEMLESKGEDHVFHLFNPKGENAQALIKCIAAFINQDTSDCLTKQFHKGDGVVQSRFSPFSTKVTEKFKSSGGLPAITPAIPQRMISPKELHVKRAKGLCFRCDEKYHHGHQCKHKHIHFMIADDEEVIGEFISEPAETETMVCDMEPSECSQLSFNAISGQASSNTIKIHGQLKRRSINILIDSGSSHTFLDQRVAKEVQCMVESTQPMMVTVADGSKMVSDYKFQNLSWTMQGIKFNHDVRLIKLGGCDMVLGVDWMKKYSHMLFDFNHLTLSFKKDGEQVVLKSFTENAQLKMISCKSLKNSFKKGACGLVGCLNFIQLEGSLVQAQIPADIDEVLQQYQDVFLLGTPNHLVLMMNPRANPKAATTGGQQ